MSPLHRSSACQRIRAGPQAANAVTALNNPGAMTAWNRALDQQQINDRVVLQLDAVEI